MPFRFLECEIDVERREPRRRGHEVHLEPQVFDLLLFLLQHRARLVSKEEIIEAVWQGRIVSEAAISSRINAVRRAVGDTGEAQTCIRTVPRRGFRFVAELKDYDVPEGAPVGKAAARADGDSKLNSSRP